MRFIKPGYHYRITSILLILLAVWVAAGTLAQARFGLGETVKAWYQAWFFPLGGWLPLPGLLSLLAVMAVALIPTLLQRPGSWRQMGMWLLHGGLLLMILGGLIATGQGQRGTLRLSPGGSWQDRFQGEDGVSLRLPTPIRLVGLDIPTHPGTERPADFISHLELNTPTGPLARQVSMNRPLSMGSLRIYQSGHGSTPEGALESELLIVENRWRYLPHASGALALLGLLIALLAPCEKRRCS